MAPELSVARLFARAGLLSRAHRALSLGRWHTPPSLRRANNLRRRRLGQRQRRRVGALRQLLLPAYCPIQLHRSGSGSVLPVVSASHSPLRLAVGRALHPGRSARLLALRLGQLSLVLSPGPARVWRARRPLCPALSRAVADQLLQLRPLQRIALLAGEHRRGRARSRRAALAGQRPGRPGHAHAPDWHSAAHPPRLGMGATQSEGSAARQSSQTGVCSPSPPGSSARPWRIKDAARSSCASRCHDLPGWRWG